MMRKVAARAAAAVVALVAGAASYQHIASVALAAGEPEWVAYTLPLAIDGLIVVGVMALLEDKAAGLLPRRSAWLAVVVGVAATLAANVASAEPTVTARLVAAAAPVAFLLSVEVLTRSGRPRPVDQSGQSATEDLPRPSPVAVVGDTLTPAAGPVTSENAARSPQATQKRPTPTRAPRRRISTAERVRKVVDRSPHATNAEIAAKLGLSERTVQRYRAATSNGHGEPVKVVDGADD